MVNYASYFTPLRVLHRCGRYGFAHGPMTTFHGFGILEISPSGAQPLSYANSIFTLLCGAVGSSLRTLNATSDPRRHTW